MKKTLILAVLFLLATPVFAAPYFRQEAGLVPITDSIYYLGTTTPATKAWAGVVTDQLCLTADTCRTSWPSTGAAFAWTPTSWGVSTSTTLGFFNGFISNASSTINANLLINGNSTTTNATTTNLHVSTGFSVLSLTSAILQTDGSGIFSEYAGTSCTNQFVRSLSALGVATCATVSGSDVSLEALTAGTGLTSAGTYTGATARTFSVDQTFSPTWTGAHIFNSITRSTTTAATTTELHITNKKITSGANYYLITGTSSPAFNIASTTLDASGKSFSVGTSTFLLYNPPEPIILQGAYCTASTTGTAIVRFGDGTNWTNDAVVTSGAYTRFTTNNTFTAFEAFNVQASSTSGSVSRLSCTTVINKTGE